MLKYNIYTVIGDKKLLPNTRGCFFKIPEFKMVNT